MPDHDDSSETVRQRARIAVDRCEQLRSRNLCVIPTSRMSISAFTRVFNALWKSGNRFSEKDMRRSKNLERIPIQPKRDAL
jgi:hypothetical protein